jgi:hypothetical protein
MRLSEILLEKPVRSSWITDLKHNRAGKILTMTLSNGKQYTIPGITRTTFEQWHRSPSKGRFFHTKIAGRFKATRIK